MTSNDTVSINVKGLEDLAKALGRKSPVGRVGVLKGSNARPDGESNATIGAAHEFGSPSHGLPARSFLRVPIATLLEKKMEAAGAFDKSSIQLVLKEKSLKSYVEKITKIAEGISIESFSNGGFGKWPVWKPGYTNNTGQILVDTQQLMKSITSEVVD